MHEGAIYMENKCEKYGKCPYCKDCRREYQRKSHLKARKTARKIRSHTPSAQDKPTQKAASASAASPQKQINDHIIELDFTEYQDIKEALIAHAADQMRSVKAHAMYLIKQAVCQ